MHGRYTWSRPTRNCVDRFDEALFSGTTLVNLIESDHYLASLETADQARLLVSKLRENRNCLAALYAAHPDARPTLIVKLLHPGIARQCAAISHAAKQIQELSPECHCVNQACPTVVPRRDLTTIARVRPPSSPANRPTPANCVRFGETGRTGRLGGSGTRKIQFELSC